LVNIFLNTADLNICTIACHHGDAVAPSESQETTSQFCGLVELALEKRCAPMQANSVRRCAFASLLEIKLML
jgi:hypothetical protein